MTTGQRGAQARSTADAVYALCGARAGGAAGTSFGEAHDLGARSRPPRSRPISDAEIGVGEALASRSRRCGRRGTAVRALAAAARPRARLAPTHTRARRASAERRAVCAGVDTHAVRPIAAGALRLRALSLSGAPPARDKDAMRRSSTPAAGSAIRAAPRCALRRDSRLRNKRDSAAACGCARARLLGPYPLCCAVLRFAAPAPIQPPARRAGDRKLRAGRGGCGGLPPALYGVVVVVVA